MYCVGMHIVIGGMFCPFGVSAAYLLAHPGRQERMSSEDDVKQGRSCAPFLLERWLSMDQYRRRAFWFFLVMGVLFFTALVARVLIPSEDVRLVLLIWQQLLFVVGGILGSRKEVFGPLNLGTVAWGLVCGLALYVVNTLLGSLTYVIARNILGNQVVQDLILSDRAGVESLLTSNKPLIVSGVMLLLVVGAPLSEELFFRGLLADLLSERVGPRRAVLIAALLFTVLHFYVLQFIPVLFAGIILGILFVRTENIFISIIAHAVVNAVTLLAWLLAL